MNIAKHNAMDWNEKVFVLVIDKRGIFPIKRKSPTWVRWGMSDSIIRVV
jgi:hypothetical protein